MAQIQRSDLNFIAKQEGLKLHNLIKRNDFKSIENTLNIICRTITFTDDFVTDEFLTAVVKEVYGEYGSDLLVAAERGYPIDFKQQEKTKEKVKTACGSEIEVETVKCRSEYTSQVFKQYYDTLTINQQKMLPVSISQAELRNISCGEETYNKIKALVISKITESIQAYIRDLVYCILNNPESYKKIEEIYYTCDSCDGDNFITALTKFSLNLFMKSVDYNIAGRLYDFPIKTKGWLLNSTNLAAKLASKYAQGGTNASYIDISQKFARVFDIPQITIADGIIMDTNWIQVRKILDNLTWTYQGNTRSECGVYNLDLKVKPINFFVAVPFKLIEIPKEDYQTAKALTNKIEKFKKEFTITSQEDAETQIKAEINKLNTKNLTTNISFLDFQEPTKETQGSIKISVAISNDEDTPLGTANNKFKLILKSEELKTSTKK